MTNDELEAEQIRMRGRLRALVLAVTQDVDAVGRLDHDKIAERLASTLGNSLEFEKRNDPKTLAYLEGQMECLKQLEAATLETSGR